MKQLFRCEYCTKIGTEEEIRKHEESCINNYNNKDCWTCKFANSENYVFICGKGKEIPTGKYISQCDKYEHKEKEVKTDNSFSSMFNNLFNK